MPKPSEGSTSLSAFAPALFLLVIAFLINYVDRGNLSIAAPLLKVELGLSPSKLGILLSVFFWTYTLMQFVMGWLVDRFDVNRLLAAGFLVWSLATAATGLMRGFLLLLSMRLILGIGESIAVPAGSKILARCLPEHHRGLGAGALFSAQRAGNALGTFGAGYLIAIYGWRPVFVGIGLISLLWLPLWGKWMPRGSEPVPHAVSPSAGAEIRTARIKTAEILAQRSFWGASLGHFASTYLFYFMITWLPSYLVEERHLTIATMTKLAGLYYTVDALSCVLGGSLQDWLIRRGYTPTLVRKGAMAIAFSLGTIGVAGCAVADAHSFIPWLMIAGIGCGMTAPGLYAFSQRIAGPEAIGRWYGPQNGLGNFAGVIGPALTGFVVQWTGNFFWPFAITSAMCVLGIIAWVFIVGRVEPMSWKSARRLPDAPVSTQV